MFKCFSKRKRKPSKQLKKDFNIMDYCHILE